MVYINNIYKGLLVFPFIAALITLPYAVYQYNKYGSVSKYRTLIIYSFILYMLIAFFMVSLPLPARAAGSRVSGLRRTWAALFDYVCAAVVYIFLLGVIRYMARVLSAIPYTERYTAGHFSA